MYTLLRHKKNRIGITLLFVFMFTMFVIQHNNLSLLREGALGALKSISFILTVISALSLVLFNNYVNGLKEKYLNKVSSVRDRIELLFDMLSDSKSQEEIRVNNEFVIPLMQLSNEEWLAFDIPNEIRMGADEAFKEVHNESHTFLPRHMIRMEGDLNELGLLFIKRIVIENHLNIIREMFLLIVTTMIAIVLLYILPSSEKFDLFLILFSFVVLLWAVMGVLHASTFLYSSGREEGDQLHLEEDEVEPEAKK